jgi:4-amino-4-deoxy-L-arabinose transferase-like glycosyltransferase
MTFLVVMAAAGLAGTWILRPLRIGGGVEGYAWRGLLGMAVCSLFILALSPHFSLDGVFRVLLAVAAVGLGWEIFSASRDRYYREPVLKPAHRPGWFEYVCGGVVAVAALLALISAMAPVAETESGAIHLSAAAQDAWANRIQAHPGQLEGPAGPLPHALFALALFHGEEYSANLFGLAFGLLACGAVYGLGRRLGGPVCGAGAAAMLAASPVFYTEAGAARVDLAFAAFVTAALTALIVWREERHYAWLFLSAVLAGSACAIRPTGYLFILLLTAGVLIAGRERRYSLAFFYAGGALLAAAPWFLYAYLPGDFSSPVHYLAERLGLLAAEPVNVGRSAAIAFVMFPWDIVMRPGLYDGWAYSPGPLVLLLGAPALLLGGKTAWRAGGFCIAGGLFIYFTAPAGQYFLPVIAPMMAVAALMLTQVPHPAWRKAVHVLVLAAFGLGLCYHGLNAAARLPVVAGSVDRSDYLAAHVPRHPAYAWVNANIQPSRGGIMSLDPNTYYFEFPVFTDFGALAELNGVPLTRQLSWLQDRDIQYVILPETYLEESNVMRELGIADLARRWANSENHFVPLHVFEFEREGGSPERVVVYGMRYPVFTQASEDPASGM